MSEPVESPASVKRALFVVDFNEMPEPDLVLLSKTDVREDANGHPVHLEVGLSVAVCMDDADTTGRSCHLHATGRVELNRRQDWSAHVKWCCRIDADSFRHRYDLVP